MPMMRPGELLMAPPGGEPGVQMPQGIEARQLRKRAQLRKLRVEVRDLQSTLESVGKGEETLQGCARYIETTMAQIGAIMASIEQFEAIPTETDKDPKLLQQLLDDDDAICHIQDLWEYMQQSPLLQSPVPALKPEEQLHHLKVLNDRMRDMVYYIGTLTIPARLNNWLAAARRGYYVPFHLVFEDEVPNAEDRTKILNTLKYAPLTIDCGLVDETNGLIYRYAKSPAAQWKSFGALVAAFLLFTTGVVVACYLALPGWPLQTKDVSALLIGWVAVMIGTVVHAVVGSFKRGKAKGGLPSIIAVDDLLPLIDARLGQIVLRLLLALMGLFGLAFAGGAANLTPLNAFLVGYSLDSFVEIFSAGLDERAAAQAATVKKQLGVTGP